MNYKKIVANNQKETAGFLRKHNKKRMLREFIIHVVQLTREVGERASNLLNV